MTAETSKFEINPTWAEWINQTYDAFCEVTPEKDHNKLLNYFQEVNDLIEDNLYPMSKEGFAMFIGDVYAAYVSRTS